MQGSETRDSRAHTTRWRQHLNPTRLWTRSATEDATRSTEHGARSTFKHSEAQALSLTRTATRHDEKLLVPHTRTQPPEPGETVNPLPEYTYTPSHTECHARAGGQPERISPRPSGCLSTQHVWTPSRLRVPASRLAP